MSSTNDAILIIGLFAYLISCLASGVIAVVLGYKLFRTGIYDKAAELRAAWGDRHLSLVSATPGTFFALFGASIIIFSLVKIHKFEARMVQHDFPKTGLQQSKLLQQNDEYPVDKSPTRPDSTFEADIRADFTPPSMAPLSPSAHMLPHRVALSWKAGVGNTRIAYYIYRDGNLIGASLTPSFVDWGVSPHTTYNYSVQAFDAVGNRSARSPSAIVKTN